MSAEYQPARLIVLLSLMLASPALPAEVYKWVDNKGKVHFSDKRYAHGGAERIDQQQHLVTEDGRTFRFLPSADALLNQVGTTPQGRSSALSAGTWTQAGSTYQVASLLRFDITELLEKILEDPQKKLYRAQLSLSANLDDKVYGQGSVNDAKPGHSTLRGDNAFYLKPVHSNWEEDTATWPLYYNSNHQNPEPVRSLPSIAVNGSGDNNRRDYTIDVTDLVKQLINGHVREFSLEMTLQRRSTMAAVTFYSREANEGKQPTLVIELIDRATGPSVNER